MENYQVLLTMGQSNIYFFLGFLTVKFFSTLLRYKFSQSVLLILHSNFSYGFRRFSLEHQSWCYLYLSSFERANWGAFDAIFLIFLSLHLQVIYPPFRSNVIFIARIWRMLPCVNSEDNFLWQYKEHILIITF